MLHPEFLWSLKFQQSNNFCMVYTSFDDVESSVLQEKCQFFLLWIESGGSKYLGAVSYSSTRYGDDELFQMPTIRSKKRSRIPKIRQKGKTGKNKHFAPEIYSLKPIRPTARPDSRFECTPQAKPERCAARPLRDRSGPRNWGGRTYLPFQKFKL